MENRVKIEVWVEGRKEGRRRRRRGDGVFIVLPGNAV
jgi:hypothetical protein